MRFIEKIIFLLLLCFSCLNCIFAQTDSSAQINPIESKLEIPKPQNKSVSTRYNPSRAIVRSAILPGWGQVTNKKIWKVPIVYAALGTTGVLFFRNLNQYRDSRAAYILATDNDPTNDFQIKEPYFSVKDQPERIRTFRNQVRQNVDYSVLFFILFWGLNVADAAVDAHLKTFDVGDNLSVTLKPGFSTAANTNGISLLMRFGK